MAKFFYLTATINETSNHHILVRDSNPHLILEYEDSFIAEICKKYFTSKVTSFELRKSDQTKLYYEYKNEYYKVPIDFNLNTKKRKSNELHEKKQQSTEQKESLLLNRITKIFEHKQIKPLGHQQRFLEKYWTDFHGKEVHEEILDWSCAFLNYNVGAGKSYASLLPFSFIHEDRVIIICSNTMISEWVDFITTIHQPDNSSTIFEVIGVTEFNRLLSEKPDYIKNQYVIFDEIHVLRNLTDNMRYMVDALRDVKFLILLSGTPLVNSLSELVTLALLMHVDLTDHEISYLENISMETYNEKKTLDIVTRIFQGKVDFYSPEVDPEHLSDYAPLNVIYVHVPMTWKQTVDYMVNRKQVFTIGHLSLQSSTRNAYNQVSIQISNFSCQRESPKTDKIVENIKKHGHYPQVIASNYIKNGIEPIYQEVQKQLSDKKSCMITGSTPMEERPEILAQYNSNKLHLLLFGPVANTGINLYKTSALHLQGVDENIQLENQTIARVRRYKSHDKNKDGTINPITVYKYISIFPDAKTINKKEVTDYFYQQYVPKHLGKQEDAIDFDFATLLIEKMHKDENYTAVEQRMEKNNNYKHTTLLPSLLLIQKLGS